MLACIAKWEAQSLWYCHMVGSNNSKVIALIHPCIISGYDRISVMLIIISLLAGFSNNICEDLQLDSKVKQDVNIIMSSSIWKKDGIHTRSVEGITQCSLAIMLWVWDTLTIPVAV